MKLILVVDDEYAIAESLRDLLEDEGYSVVTAGNGRAALERMAERRPDLVVLDLMMPVLDGRRTLETMAADARFAEVPVVIMSAAPALVGLDASVSNIVGILQKPFSIEALLGVVSEHVGATQEAT